MVILVNYQFPLMHFTIWSNWGELIIIINRRGQLFSRGLGIHRIHSLTVLFMLCQSCIYLLLMQIQHVLLLLLHIVSVHLVNRVAFILKKPQEQEIRSWLLTAWWKEANYWLTSLLKQHCLALLPFCCISDKEAAQRAFAVLLNHTWHGYYGCCQLSHDRNFKGQNLKK